MGAPRRIALKVDVDTYRGTREGVPAMLEDLAAAGVRASFYLSLGPDNSGRAVLRVFRKPGFLKKMLRTNPAKMYGIRTMLYGTLLPAPRIGKRLVSTLRQIADAGHEVGLHAWDHVRWQDALDRLRPAQVRAELTAGVRAFQEIYGDRPVGFAAPAWFSTPEALVALEELGFLHVSVARGRSGPFRPVVGGRVLKLVEVPTTLPTLDEVLGRDGVDRDGWNDHLTGRYREGADEVITVHAETEGLAFRREFQDLLRRHRDAGVAHVTVGELAAEAAARSDLACRTIELGEIPGRAGRVSVPGPVAAGVAAGR